MHGEYVAYIDPLDGKPNAVLAAYVNLDKSRLATATGVRPDDPDRPRTEITDADVTTYSAELAAAVADFNEAMHRRDVAGAAQGLDAMVSAAQANGRRVVAEHRCNVACDDEQSRARCRVGSLDLTDAPKLNAERKHQLEKLDRADRMLDCLDLYGSAGGRNACIEHIRWERPPAPEAREPRRAARPSDH